MSHATVHRAEKYDDVPVIQARRLAMIQRALETAGVGFLDLGQASQDGGAGVRLAQT